MNGGVRLKILAEVHRLYPPLLQLVLKGVRQRHVAELVVVAESFSVHGHAYQLRPVPAVPVAGFYPVGESRGVLGEAVKSRRLRKRPVVKKDGEAAAFRPTSVGQGIVPDVGAGRIKIPGGDVRPFPVLLPRYFFGLIGGKNYVFHPQIHQQAERIVGSGGLREPHGLGLEAEAVLEIPDPPQGLRELVLEGGQRHYYVVVGLGYGVGVARPLPGFAARLDYLIVIERIMFLQPGEERGAEVEVQPQIVVGQLQHAAGGVVDAGAGIGEVAFPGYARVPVVERPGGRLGVYFAGPGVFPGGLVEMRVQREKSIMSGVMLFHCLLIIDQCRGGLQERPGPAFILSAGESSAAAFPLNLRARRVIL